MWEYNDTYGVPSPGLLSMYLYMAMGPQDYQKDTMYSWEFKGPPPSHPQGIKASLRG